MVEVRVKVLGVGVGVSPEHCSSLSAASHRRRQFEKSLDTPSVAFAQPVMWSATPAALFGEAPRRWYQPIDIHTTLFSMAGSDRSATRESAPAVHSEMSLAILLFVHGTQIR
jgi:hypothetical protein